MLLILTGDIQIGKTRWLSARIEQLAQRGVAAYGVLSPGDWRLRPNGEVGGEAAHGMAGAGRYEKFGINCVLLPQGERIRFADRRDLAEAAGSYDGASQSAKAQLGWAIDDAAIKRVNAHFDAIAARADAAVENAGSRIASRGLLVVDELGRLELMRGEGFSSATALLDRGETPLYRTAVVIVRDSLADLARGRLAPAWGDDVRFIHPDEDGERMLRTALRLR